MDRGLVPVPLVGGLGMSDWTQASPVRFLSREFKTPSGEIFQPTRARRLARASLRSCAPAHNQPIGAQPRPPGPGASLTLQLPARAALVQRAAEGSPRCPGGFARPLREVPFLSLRMFSGASSLTFLSALSNPLRENPPETMDFLPGLVRFSFCGLQVAVLLARSARQFLPRPSRLKKTTGCFLPQKAADLYFRFRRYVGWFKLHLSPSEGLL